VSLIPSWPLITGRFGFQAQYGPFTLPIRGFHHAALSFPLRLLLDHRCLRTAVCIPAVQRQTILETRCMFDHEAAYRNDSPVNPARPFPRARQYACEELLRHLILAAVANLRHPRWLMHQRPTGSTAPARPAFGCCRQPGFHPPGDDGRLRWKPDAQKLRASLTTTSVAVHPRKLVVCGPMPSAWRGRRTGVALALLWKNGQGRGLEGRPRR